MLGRRVEQLRALGVRRFSALPYAHKPGIAGYLNDWARSFARGVPECLHSATIFPEPSAADYIADAIDDPQNEISKLVAREPDDRKVVNELFLRILNRPVGNEYLITEVAGESIAGEPSDVARGLAYFRRALQGV